MSRKYGTDENDELQTSEERAEQDLDMALLRDYIGECAKVEAEMNTVFSAYAKATVAPRLSDEASQLLIDKYLFMRKVRQL